MSSLYTPPNAYKDPWECSRKALNLAFCSPTPDHYTLLPIEYLKTKFLPLAWTGEGLAQATARYGELPCPQLWWGEVPRFGGCA